MYNINSEKTEIQLTLVLYRHNALQTYYEKSRHSDGFIYYVKGGHKIYHNNRIIVAGQGDLLYLPYMAEYSNELAEKHTEYYQIDFQLYENGKPVRLFETVRLWEGSVADNAYHLMYKIFNTYTARINSYGLLCNSDILKIIGIVSVDGTYDVYSGQCSERIRNSVSYITEHYYEDTPLEVIAAMSNVSVSTLGKRFKNELGLSPIAYRNKIRTEQAKLLLSSGYSISETAEKTGFSDYFYFVKTFKKYAHCTPGEYKGMTASI